MEKNDTKSDSPIEELQKSDSQSKPHPNSNHTEPPASIPEDKSETSLHENKAETMNDQNIEQNDEILRFSTAEPANPITNKAGEKNLCSEITIQSNRKPTVKEYDEPLTAPVVQIPDSSREFPLAQDAKNMQSLGPMQTTNSNYYPLTARNPETVITIVNDDALINASSSSVIIVNISGRQKKRDNVNNVSDDAEIGPPLVNKVMDIKVPSESSGMKMAQFPDGTRIVNRMQDTNEVRTPMAIHIDHVSPTATTPTGRLSPVSVNTEGQRSKTVSPKIDRKSNDKSSKINSKGCSANKFETSQNVMLEQNLAAKLKEKPKQKTNLKANQSDKQVCDTSKNDAKLDEVSKDSKEPTSLSMQRNEFEHISDSSGYDKENDSADKSQLSQKSIVAGTDEIQTTCTASNSIKIHESSITNNNSSDKKRVTLVTPSVTDMNLEMESGKAKIFSDSEGQLNSSSKHTVTGNSSATTTTSVITTAAITNTTTSNSMTDITQCTTASKDVIMHTTTAKKEIPNLQQKYQSENETSFEADFTPRDSRIQRNSTHMKTSQKIKIDMDLNMGVCGLSKQSSYDPDFKDYDFI